MKKIISSLLAIAMLLSIVVMPVSATTIAGGNWNGGTHVSYNAEDPNGDGILDNTEAYTVTVPAQLAPGTGGEVVLTGTWNSARKVVVTADRNVILKNSINPDNTKDLAVEFGDINQIGDNEFTIEVKKDISVEAIDKAIFGTWSGKFNYMVDVVDATDSSDEVESKLHYTWNTAELDASNNPVATVSGFNAYIRLTDDMPSDLVMQNTAIQTEISGIPVEMVVYDSLEENGIRAYYYNELMASEDSLPYPEVVIVSEPGTYEFFGEMCEVEETGMYVINIEFLATFFDVPEWSNLDITLKAQNSGMEVWYSWNTYTLANSDNTKGYREQDGIEWFIKLDDATPDYSTMKNAIMVTADGKAIDDAGEMYRLGSYTRMETFGDIDVYTTIEDIGHGIDVFVVVREAGQFTWEEYNETYIFPEAGFYTFNWNIFNDVDANVEINYDITLYKTNVDLENFEIYYRQPYNVKVGECLVTFFAEQDGRFVLCEDGCRTASGTFEINGNSMVVTAEDGSTEVATIKNGGKAIDLDGFTFTLNTTSGELRYEKPYRMWMDLGDEGTAMIWVDFVFHSNNTVTGWLGEHEGSVTPFELNGNELTIINLGEDGVESVTLYLSADGTQIYNIEGGYNLD